MKRVALVFASLSVLLPGLAPPCSAGNRVSTSSGYWDFEGVAQIDGRKGDRLKITVGVRNVSTDSSYVSAECSEGMASAAVDWEVWHPDVGLVASGKERFHDVCNWDHASESKVLTVPAKLNHLEIRWNITTPEQIGSSSCVFLGSDK
jgi:hypothetical protein